MVHRLVETVLANYLRTFQTTGEPLDGFPIYEGHRANVLPESETARVVVICIATGGELLETTNLHTCQISIRIEDTAASAVAGQERDLSGYDAAADEVYHILADARLDDVITWIADTQSAVAVECNALRFTGSAEGRLPDRERVAVVLSYEGEFFRPLP